VSEGLLDGERGGFGCVQDVAGELVGGGCEGGAVDDVHLLVDFALDGQVVLSQEAQFGLFAGVS
jgi:hypothetical protein